MNPKKLLETSFKDISNALQNFSSKEENAFNEVTTECKKILYAVSNVQGR